MSAWSTRRQLSFVLVFILILILIIVGLIAANRHVDSCTDNLQNQGELDVDCGGPCSKVCALEVSEVKVIWARVFHTRDTLYDVGIYIENPNPFTLISLPYHVRIFDKDLVPIKDVDGATFVNAHERLLIVITNVNLGFRTPQGQPTVTFDPKLEWERLTGLERLPVLTVLNKRLASSTSGVNLSATVRNDSLFEVSDIEADAVVYDSSGTAVLVSKSKLSSLLPGGTTDVVFTWPKAPASAAVSADIFVRTDLTR